MLHVSDNTLVQQTDTHNEFFCVIFRELHPEYQFTVSLGRYCVPGRLDIYDFDYAPSLRSGFGDRVRYFSDTGVTMPDALKMIAKDLNRKNVVEMVENLALPRRYNSFRRDLTHNLLRIISPNSKTYKRLLEYENTSRS